MLVSREKSICILRNLYRELRCITNHKKSTIRTVRQTPLWQKIIFLNREKNNSSSRKDNDANVLAKNLLQAGEIYLAYMRSTREYEAMLKSYKGHGERSVEDQAKIMGFSLPHSHNTPTSDPSGSPK